MNIVIATNFFSDAARTYAPLLTLAVSIATQFGCSAQHDRVVPAQIPTWAPSIAPTRLDVAEPPLPRLTALDTLLETEYTPIEFVDLIDIRLTGPIPRRHFPSPAASAATNPISQRDPRASVSLTVIADRLRSTRARLDSATSQGTSTAPPPGIVHRATQIANLAQVVLVGILLPLVAFFVKKSSSVPSHAHPITVTGSEGVTVSVGC